jgi:hypothetical protein
MTPTAILALIDSVILLVEKIPPALSALKRSTEMTPEEEAALDARIQKLKSLPHWQVED